MALKSWISAGIDLGGTSIRVGLFDEELQMLASRSLPTRVSDGPHAAVREMAAALNALRTEVGADQIVGVGIGSPGPINLRTGVLGLLPNLPGWDNFPLRDSLAAATSLPVVLESDANAAAIAEWKLGAGRDTGLDTMAMLTLGTGVGSGLILHGKVWHGMFGMGGEAGHMSVDPNGETCGCGTRGCLELYGSANGVIRLARKIAHSEAGTPALHSLVTAAEGFTPRDVAEMAEQRDPAAMAVFAGVGRYLGIGIANLISVLDLPMIVVGGGVATAWPYFAPGMFAAVREYSVVYRLVEPKQRIHMEADRTYILPAALGASAGLIGAALLPALHGLMAKQNDVLQETLS